LESSLEVKTSKETVLLLVKVVKNFQFINNLPGDLEAQLAALQGRKPSILSASDKVHAVEDLSRQLTEAGVTENKHTDLALPTLKVDYEQLVKVTQNKETLIQKEIIGKTNSSVSAEQLAEFKEVFAHFDKEKNGLLGRLDFKAALQSLDFDYQDAQIDSLISEIGTNGKVSFEAFFGHVSKKAADSDNQDQILEAFKVISGGKDFVTEDDLKRALPAEKVTYLVGAMPVYKGQAGTFDFTAWAHKSFH